MKRILTPLFLLSVMVLATPTTQAQRAKDNIRPIAVGIGADIDGSFGAFNWGIPIEVRLGRASDPFTLHIGERISFHRGGGDSSDYWDPGYGMWLFEPTISFTQFSTYIHGRWNCYRSSEFTAFVGAGYYMNINTNPRLNIDIPNISLINNNIVYTYHDGRRRFYCDDLVNRISHSMRIEVGAANPVFELTVFLSFDLTRPFKRSVVRNNVYYDPYCIDRNVYTFPVDATYSAINLASLEDINDATRDIVFVGCGLKFFLFSGYFNK